MRRPHRLYWLALAAAGLVAAPAFAGPPYVTDDPEPTDLAKWEVYGFASGIGFAHGVDGETGFDVNYGAAKDLQASAVVSLDVQHDRGAAVQTGVADTELGLKYRFLHQRDGSWIPDVALFPKLELPTARKRFGSGAVGAQIPVWAQKDFGRWSLFGGGGYQINPRAGNRDFGFGGVSLTRQVTKTLSIGAEAYHQSADSIDTRSTTGIDLGMNWQVAPHWSILGSGGPIVAHRDTAGRYAFYAALEFHD